MSIEINFNKLEEFCSDSDFIIVSDDDLKSQKIFWNTYLEKYGKIDEGMVADPNKYGTHNIKINAVDYLLVKLDGSEVEMPCHFDEFGEKATIFYQGGYDERIKDYGMKYDYSKTKLIPINYNDVFILNNEE